MSNTNNKSRVVTVRLTEEQFDFLEQWRQKKEKTLGIDVPMGVLLRRLVDVSIERKKMKMEKLPPMEKREKELQYVKDYDE